MDLETIILTPDDFPVCLFSDLHADLNSLEQLIRATPEAGSYYCGGDFIDMHRSLAENDRALARCRELGVRGVRGNHDNDAMAIGGIISEGSRDILQELPDILVLAYGDFRVGLLHATPRNANALCAPQDYEPHLASLEVLGLAMILVGHTHFSARVSFGDVEVINLGHLGEGLFGDDWRSYALLDESGLLELRRCK